MVSFTGSTQVGKIMKTCSNSIKRISLELGGKNSMIILKDANLSTSINNLISSFTVNACEHAWLFLKYLFTATSLMNF